MLLSSLASQYAKVGSWPPFVTTQRESRPLPDFTQLNLFSFEFSFFLHMKIAQQSVSFSRMLKDKRFVEGCKETAGF